jgi:hypothetical protein
MDYYGMAERLAKKYIKTKEGYEWLLDDLKEIYNHQFFEGFEVIIENIVNGAYDNRDKYKSVREYEFELWKQNN